jgi:pimeloyl-ACP methyl ester carboxylesterase
VTSSAITSRTASASETVDAVRARLPDRDGYAVRDGVRLRYEIFGDGPTTVVLLPTWAIVHSRVWKAQVPYLSRHFRVVTFDPRGNGGSDRPSGAAAYDDRELVADTLAVLDATDTARAVCVGLSMGARVLLQLAAAHPQRVAGAVFIAPSVKTEVPSPVCWVQPFDAPAGPPVGWGLFNADHWRRDLAGFSRFFFGEIFSEPHSTKQVDDAVEWTLDTDAATLVDTQHAPHHGDGARPDEPETAELASRLRCPCLVVHGDEDRIVDVRTGLRLAELIGCRADVIAGGGHCVPARHPVHVNLLLREFAGSVG